MPSGPSVRQSPRTSASPSPFAPVTIATIYMPGSVATE
jgi:hypothetical protein